MNRSVVFRALAGILAIAFIGTGVLFYGSERSPWLSWLGFGLALSVVAATGVGLSRRGGDSYQAVESARHTLTDYPCGVRAGERLRLKDDLDLLDSAGCSTRRVIPAGTIWTVLPGLPHEPNVIWLQQPDGEMHTWGETVLEDFDRCDALAV